MVNGFDEVFEESDGHPLEHITSSTATSAPVPTGVFEANNPSTPEDSRLPEVVELWDPSRRRFAIPFQRSRSREGFKAYISEIGLSAGVRESIRQDRFSFVDHRNRHIPTPAWRELVVPGSVVKLEIPDNEFYYNSERPARVSHYKSLTYELLHTMICVTSAEDMQPQINFADEDRDYFARKARSTSITETSLTRRARSPARRPARRRDISISPSPPVRDSAPNGQMASEEDIQRAGEARRVRRTRSASPPARVSAPSVQIASEEDIQREDEETIQIWKSSLPNSVNLNTLARWSHSSGHVDANMAKVITLYALLGGHPNNTSSYVMRMGVRLAERGSAMNGKTAISTLIAVMRALRASESSISEPDVLREIHRRNACEQLFPPDKNPDFGLAGIWDSPHWHAFDAMNIWTRHKRMGRSYFRTLPKLTADPVVHADNTFRSDDLNIYALKNAGKLDIRWTDRVEDHLLLWLGGNVDDDASDSFDSSSGSNSNYRHFDKPTLEIYWFDFKHYAWVARHFLRCEESEAVAIALEVRRTWAFLFYPNTWRQRSKVRKIYAELPVPEWARSTFINNGGGHHQHQNATANHHIMASPINSDAQELQFHRQNSNMFRYHSTKTGGFEYQLFPYFGKRIQKLRRHLDSSKPKSLLDLARIKDPVTFYTVVVALVLGVVSVVLAFLSLAASLVQTWASVKALHSSTSS